MDHDDFQPPEPIDGLPEVPPDGERILWQGKPDWLVLANEAFMLRWVAIYFVMLAVWRGLAGWLNHDVERGVLSAVWLVVIGVVACGLIALSAWVQARATVYTVTNRRIVMRIGAALTLALNLPYRWIGKADLRLRRQGTGTITFDLLGETRFSYLVCWPHVRPWHVQKTQPAFRCIRDAEHVAGLIAEHARTEIAASDARAEPAAIPAE
ncbi:MAG: photosynthetic complex putative assembly protein PuhB [Pseudomonadota bacterium]